MGKKKIVKIYCGSDVSLCIPSHPLQSAILSKKIVDMIVAGEDSDYEYSLNSLSSVQIFEFYGRKKGLSIQYYLNGVKSSYKAIKSDLQRDKKYLQQIFKENEIDEFVEDVF